MRSVLSSILGGIITLVITISSPYAAPSLVQENFGSIPLYFTENLGQFDPQVKFTTQGNGCEMFFTTEGPTFLLTRETEASKNKRAEQFTKNDPTQNPADFKPEYEGYAFKLSFKNANKNPVITGEDRLPWDNNYFIGNDESKWRSNVPNYKKITIKEVYNGVDLEYYGDSKNMKYNFIVKPGSDPKTIRLAYDFGKEFRGQKLVKNTKDELELETPFGKLTERKPYSYQIIDGKKVEVAINYSLAGVDTNELAFDAVEYNPNYELVIDPVLEYSTFVSYGADGRNAVDDLGYVYIVVRTGSFPTTAGAYNTNWGPFGVAKINTSGTGLVYATYMGCSGGSECRPSDIKIDSSGNAYITGYTNSPYYPVTSGVYDDSIDGTGGYESFVTKLNSSGTALVYSTYMNSSYDGSISQSIAVDSNNCAYITGYMYHNSYNYHLFVKKLNSNGTAAAYSYELWSAAGGEGIVVDSSGCAYIGGTMLSGSMPTTYGVYDRDINDGVEGYFLKLNSTGTSVDICSYLGLYVPDYVRDIALDSSGNIYVAIYMWNGTSSAVRVLKYSSSGSSLYYMRELDGSGTEFPSRLVVDSTGRAHVTGWTESSNFPTTAGAYDTTFNGGKDAFFSVVSSNGNQIEYSTYLGGSQDDNAWDIGLDGVGDVYISGYTFSSDFPITPGAFDSTKVGQHDVFLMKFTNNPPRGTIAGTISNSQTSSPIQGVVVSIPQVGYADTTDANGHYSIPNLITFSTYTVIASDRRYINQTTTNVSVSDGGTTTVNFSLIPCGQIAGIITQATSGTPIPGVTITALPADSVATSASNGYYWIRDIRTGTYNVVINKEDYYHQLHQNQTISTGDSLSIGAGLTPLVPGGTISATIKDAVTGANVVGGVVTVSGGPYWDFSEDVWIMNIPAGNGYTVSVNKNGYMSYNISNVSVVLNQTTSLGYIYITPLTHGLVSGTITDASTGQPIASATVRLLPHDRTTSTNANGVYLFDAVPVGTGKSVTVSKGGYVSNSQGNVTVNAGSTTYVNLALTPVPKGTLSGTIIHAVLGTAVPNAVVTLTPGSYADTTSASGSYSIPDIYQDDDYTVTVTATGFQNTVRDSVEVIGDITNTLNLFLTPVPDTGSIAGQVTDIDTGAPIAEAMVTVLPDSLVDLTDDNGNYEVEDVPAGTGYSLKVSAFAYRDTVITGLQKIAGVTTNQDVEVPIEPTGTVVFHVTFNGNPVDSCVVSLREGTTILPEGDEIWYTDANGNKSVNVTVGKYIPRAQGPAGTEWTVKDEIDVIQGGNYIVNCSQVSIPGTKYLQMQFSPDECLSGSLNFVICRNYAKQGTAEDGEQISDADLLSGFQRACDKWNVMEQYTGIHLSVIGVVGYDYSSANRSDGISQLFFGVCEKSDSGEIEYTGSDPVTKRMIECDIVFNKDSYWYIDGRIDGPITRWGDNKEKDLVPIAMHEIGHALGFRGSDVKTHSAWYFDHFIMEGVLESWLYDIYGQKVFFMPGIDIDVDIQSGDKAGAYFLSGVVPTGQIPFTIGMSVNTGTQLIGDIYVPANDSLYIDSMGTKKTLNMNGHRITCAAGGEIIVGTGVGVTLSPDIRVTRIVDNHKAIVGLFPTVAAADSFRQSGDKLEITYPTGLTVSGHLVFPENSIVHMGDARYIYINSSSDTLTIGHNVTITSMDSLSYWGSLKVSYDGVLRFLGSCTIERATSGLYLTTSDALRVPNVDYSYLTINIKDSRPVNKGAVVIQNCSPVLYNLNITTSASNEYSAIWISGTDSYPLLYNMTINDYKYGIFIGETADALLQDSVLEDLSNHCIYLVSDTDSLISATIDLDQAQTDICPIYDPIQNIRAIYNPSPYDSVDARGNYWGSGTFDANSLFKTPAVIDYSFYQSIPYGIGAYKPAVISQKSLLRMAADYEVSGDYESALSLYYQVINTDTSTSHKRRAFKAILRISTITNHDLEMAKQLMTREMNDTDQGYRAVLDYLYTDILIHEGHYQEAISRFEKNALKHEGTHFQVEIYGRMAALYDTDLKDMQKAKEYTDRVASINPGEPILDELYQSLGIDYDSSRYKDRFASSDDGRNVKGLLPQKQDTDTKSQPVVNVIPNPANPMTSIHYTVFDYGKVSLSIYSITGQKVATLVDDTNAPGAHSAVFDGSNLGSGVYIYEFKVKDYRKVGKILLVK